MDELGVGGGGRRGRRSAGASWRGAGHAWCTGIRGSRAGRGLEQGHARQAQPLAGARPRVRARAPRARGHPPARAARRRLALRSAAAPRAPPARAPCPCAPSRPTATAAAAAATGRTPAPGGVRVWGVFIAGGLRNSRGERRARRVRPQGAGRRRVRGAVRHAPRAAGGSWRWARAWSAPPPKEQAPKRQLPTSFFSVMLSSTDGLSTACSSCPTLTAARQASGNWRWQRRLRGGGRFDEHARAPAPSLALALTPLPPPRQGRDIFFHCAAPCP